ncbi:MAG: cbb3-type cytochrome oxidase assembly protein CcoS [Aquisalimonadaceae bacterium]
MNLPATIDMTMVQFLIALLMGLGSLGVFIWAVLSGMFRDVEQIKMRAYRAEVSEDDEQQDDDRNDHYGLRLRRQGTDEES